MRIWYDFRCNPQHVLYSLLPPRKKTGYNLRKLSHGLTLPDAKTSFIRKNFFIRMLYTDVYWHCFIFSYLHYFTFTPILFCSCRAYRLCVCQRRLIKKLIDWLIDWINKCMHSITFSVTWQPCFLSSVCCHGNSPEKRFQLSLWHF